MNVYLDPTSWAHLDNITLEKKEEEIEDDAVRAWRYLKEYCATRGLHLNTIDVRGTIPPRGDDVYVSLAHKNALKTFLWRLKNNAYPSVNVRTFARRILLQGEPPMAEPEAYQNIKGLLRMYDKVYFPFKFGHPDIGFYQIPFSRDAMLPSRENRERKFLTIINANKSPRNAKKFLLLMASGGGFRYLGYRELLSERIHVIEFFAQTNDIDLYGYDWDKRPPFPYWFYRKRIARAYKGPVESKLRKLSEYNFALAFENCSLPSHISEKMFDCLYAGAVPVYLGAPDIEEYIPKDCFIHVRDFKNYEELRRFLKSLTVKEIQKYRERGRVFLTSDRMRPFTKEYFAEFFVNVVKGKV